MEREWKLGNDLYPEDNILDSITFDEIIKTVHCNCPEITPFIVMHEALKVMRERIDDFEWLLGRNLNEIVEYASKYQD